MSGRGKWWPVPAAPGREELSVLMNRENAARAKRDEEAAVLRAQADAKHQQEKHARTVIGKRMIYRVPEGSGNE